MNCGNGMPTGISAPGVTRTLDLRIRNPLLYPAELRAQSDGILMLSRVIAILSILLLDGRLIFSGETPTVRSMNALMTITPYKHHGMWVFDDANVGLVQEPFIAGTDALIDKATANIPNAERGFRAIFSAQRFPGADFKLEWRREESGGNWYYSAQFQQEGWLCPALLKYFAEPPKEIHVKVEALKG